MDTQFEYITSNPEILNGKPIIKGTRISVDMILEWIGSGAVFKEKLKSIASFLITYIIKSS